MTLSALSAPSALAESYVNLSLAMKADLSLSSFMMYEYKTPELSIEELKQPFSLFSSSSTPRCSRLICSLGRTSLEK